MSGQPETRVIKRYANRKLYDMQESCYITHDEIAGLVREGQEVQIIDKETQEDLTAITLAQILFKQDQHRHRMLPLQTLHTILQSGGDFIQKRIAQPVTALRGEAEERVRHVRRVFRPGETEKTQEDPSVPAGQAPGWQVTTESFREWLDNASRAYENLQSTVEDRWSLTINALDHLDDHRKRIRQLEQRVADLEAMLSDASRGDQS